MPTHSAHVRYRGKADIFLSASIAWSNVGYAVKWPELLDAMNCNLYLSIDGRIVEKTTGSRATAHSIRVAAACGLRFRGKEAQDRGRPVVIARAVWGNHK
jgi:hypothetical protein